MANCRNDVFWDWKLPSQCAGRGFDQPSDRGEGRLVGDVVLNSTLKILPATPALSAMFASNSSHSASAAG